MPINPQMQINPQMPINPQMGQPIFYPLRAHQEMMRNGDPNRLAQPAARNEAPRVGEPRGRENPNRRPGDQVPRNDVERADDAPVAQNNNRNLREVANNDWFL